MLAAEVVVHEMEAHGGGVVLKLLGEGVGESCVAADAHARGQVQPLNVKGCPLSSLGSVLVKAHKVHRLLRRITLYGKLLLSPIKRTGVDSYSLNDRQFKDLLLYAAERLADDPQLGETKLNKVLFFADFTAYARLGEPITGAEYQRNHYGPTARRFTIMRDWLVQHDQARVEKVNVGDHEEHALRPLVRPNMDAFSAEQRAIIEEVIERLRTYSNTGASELSHEESAGWNALPQGATIPYETVFVSTRPAPDEAVELGKRLAAKHGW